MLFFIFPIHATFQSVIIKGLTIIQYMVHLFVGHYGNCFLSRNGAVNWFLRVVRRYPNAGVLLSGFN